MPPDPFNVLEMAKMSLMADGSAVMTEAQAMDQAFYEQVAQRRRMYVYGAKDREVVANRLQTEKARPEDFAGLEPTEIMDTVSDAVELNESNRRRDERVMSRRAVDQEEAKYAKYLSDRDGKTYLSNASPPPEDDRDTNTLHQTAPAAPFGHNVPTLGSQGLNRATGEIDYKGATVAPHPAEAKYGPLEDARAKRGDGQFYEMLARNGTDPHAFVQALAGQLTVQRARALGDEDPSLQDPIGAQMYADRPWY